MEFDAILSMQEIIAAFPWVNPDLSDEEWLKAYGPLFPWIASEPRDFIAYHAYWLELRSKQSRGYDGVRRSVLCVYRSSTDQIWHRIS